MRNAVSHFLAFAAGCAAMYVSSHPPALVSNAFSPPQVYRTYFDSERTKIETEQELDSKGMAHGEYRIYHRSGRLKSVIDMHHGQLGRGVLYSDDTPDSEMDGENSK